MGRRDEEGKVRTGRGGDGRGGGGERDEKGEGEAFKVCFYMMYTCPWRIDVFLC